MVTYLACFIVCNFQYEEKLTRIHKTQFRVYATPEQISRVKYSLDIGANITDFFTDYYHIPYPLPKQDMIAIPDFVSGAMEHWGLITYRSVQSAAGEEQNICSGKQIFSTTSCPPPPTTSREWPQSSPMNWLTCGLGNICESASTTEIINTYLLMTRQRSTCRYSFFTIQEPRHSQVVGRPLAE